MTRTAIYRTTALQLVRDMIRHNGDRAPVQFIAVPVMNAMEVSVVWIDAQEAEKLRQAIERSKIATEHAGGADLEAIVAETAYDYWPQRAALTRARQRAAERISARDEVRAIRAEERTELVAAIGRTQEALRDEIDLGSIRQE